MKKQNKLLLQRNIFIFIIIISFSIIIVEEKKSEILLPKVKKIFDNYITDNYSKEVNDFKKGKMIFKNNSFIMKITSKKNKHLYFTLTYKNKKIKDTYKEDYLKGKTLLTHIENIINKNIKEKTNNNTNIIINTTLDNTTDIVKEKILKEEGLLKLSVYTLEDSIDISNWNNDFILTKINEKINYYENNNISPKNYSLTINNKNNITESIKIDNITKDFLTNPNQLSIINAIILNDTNDYLTQSKITYKYLN